MANQHIFQNNLIITGSVTASQGFYGDGSGLTGITAVAEWDGSRNGDASITGSFVVSGSGVNVDFTNAEAGVSGSFSGSFEGDGSGLTGLNLNGYEASGSILSGSFSGSFQGDGSGLTNLNIFPYNGDAVITGSLTVSGSSVIIDFTDTLVISGSIFSGSFVGDGSGLTNIPASEWDGSRNGDASITGSLIVSGSGITVDLLGDVTIDRNIEISNRGDNNKDLGIGYNALPETTFTSRNSIAIGYLAGESLLSGSCNVFIGDEAGNCAVKTFGNISIGAGALRNNTGTDTGQGNTFSSNTAVGHNALYNSTLGYYNVGIGFRALYGNQAGVRNTAIGNNAATANDGTEGVFIGYDAGSSRLKWNKDISIGVYSGKNAQGTQNVLIGYCAGYQTNNYNTALGTCAGKFSGNASDRNVYIGYKAGPSTLTSESCQLYIGINSGTTPLIKGDFGTGVVIINSCLKVTEASGSFIGDGSGLTGISGDGFPYDGAAVISGSLFVSQSTAAGTAVTVENGHLILAQVSASLNFPLGDAQAAANGVPLGGIYRSGNMLAIRIT
jgi:hypothetical protein